MSENPNIHRTLPNLSQIYATTIPNRHVQEDLLSRQMEDRAFNQEDLPDSTHESSRARVVPVMSPPFSHHRANQQESMEIPGIDSNDRAQPVPYLNPNLSLSNPRYEDPVLPEQIDRAQQIPSFPPHPVNAIPQASRLADPPKRNFQISQNAVINKAPALIEPTINTPKIHEDFLESLTCLICKDIFLDPVQSTCTCAITICRECSVKNKNKCPMCRQRTNYQPNRIVRDLVGKIPYRCICGQSYKRDDKEKHEKQCPQIIRKCGLCNFDGNRGQMLDHLYDKHYLNIFYYFAEPIQDRVVSRN